MINDLAGRRTRGTDGCDSESPIPVIALGPASTTMGKALWALLTTVTLAFSVFGSCCELAVIVLVPGVMMSSGHSVLGCEGREKTSPVLTGESAFSRADRIRLPSAMKRDESPQSDRAADRFSMHLFVAFGAQRDQVLFLVAT